MRFVYILDYLPSRCFERTGYALHLIHTLGPIAGGIVRIGKRGEGGVA
ncbi:hypothetical protein Enr17x_42480 [Gimesia fumaroli]|uniref:Uncharacterized protein n=1 Tax=Gimesia fumaroli TaxID=2527976 RepID=A0A518IGH3_9PLAN|nr:hypothetical protein Enr17x_42480 [Gimesia fumaroli]